MNIEHFLLRINNPNDLNIIKEAYDYAEKYLNDKKRKNGDLEINHCLEVANILIDLNVDTTTIVSAILHNIYDYAEPSEEDIIKNFGEEVNKIISSVSKINHLEMVSDNEDGAMYLRKVMVGMCEDVRVLFIKLADRLHNMKTMHDFSAVHQKKVANETLNVLVPIAHRLGINSIKSELENMCLYYLKPQVYNDILEKLNDTTSELNEYLVNMKESISNILAESDIKFEIKGRVKSVYSIYNKLNNGKKWEDIYDILALRVFVEKESDCYAAMGAIHSKFKPLPNRFKDYIAIPKENMYQSLHTTVFGEGGRFFEIQIRTYEMDEIAEKGIASHWSYKEKGTKKIQSIMEQKLEMYRFIIENNDNTEDSEFSALMDNNILTDLIYVFTPKGDVIELPKGSTPIDFAYRIHSKVGDSMIGAIVNDHMVPINSELNENDVVKIMTSSTAKPKKDWLNIVKTNQARNKIKAFFSKIDKDEYIEKGKLILEKEIRKRKLAISDVINPQNIDKICQNLKLKDLEDIYVSIGAFRYTASNIINEVISKDEERQKEQSNRQENHKIDILVDGKKSIITHLARCCNPVKGDDIIGIITKNDGIAVHRTCCESKHSNNHEVNVSWNDKSDNLYLVKVIITASDSKNNFTDIIASLTSLNLSIVSVDSSKENIYKVSFKVKNIDELNKAVNSLNKLRYVKDVQRI